MPFRYISQRLQVIKSFRSAIGKTAVIFPAAFLAALSVSMLQLGLIFYLRDVFGTRKDEVGGVFALWFLCYFLCCLLARPLLHRVRPGYLLLGATVLMGGFTLGILAAASVAAACVLFVLVGCSASLFWPPLMGWVSSGVEGTRLNRAMGGFNFSWSSGGIVGVLAAGWLSQVQDALPLYVAGCAFLSAGLLIAGALLALPHMRGDSAADTQDAQGEPVKDQSTPLRFPAWVGLYASFVGLGVLAYIFPMSARADLRLSEGWVGVLQLCRMSFATICFVLIGRTAFWHFRWLPQVVAQFCIALLFVGMAHARDFVTLALLMSGIGALGAVSYSNSFFHGAAGSTRRAARMAVQEALIAVGLITGALVGGVIYQRFPIQTVYWFCAGLMFALAIIQSGMSIFFRKAGKIAEVVPVEDPPGSGADANEGCHDD